MNHVNKALRGFTLIELSIVLVIIGLIVGGVLMGQTLIRAAEVRATISQKERFSAAVETFVGKYGNLPGDLPNATGFGFPTSYGVPTSMNCSSGSGLGVIYNGQYASTPVNNNYCFWNELTYAGLIAERPNNANPEQDQFAGDYTPTCPICNTSITGDRGYNFQTGGWWVADLDQMSTYWSSGNYVSGGGTPLMARALVLTNSGGLGGHPQPTIRPTDAYAIDSKIDDGMPMTGTVIAINNTYFNTPLFNLPTGINSATNAYSTTDTYTFDLFMKAGF